jgi:hypothetical protein
MVAFSFPEKPPSKRSESRDPSKERGPRGKGTPDGATRRERADLTREKGDSPAIR